MKRLSAALVALALAASPAMAASPAPDHVLSDVQAASQCGPLDGVLAVLAKQYGEHVFWWGDEAGDVTMIITERPDTRTWTLLAVHDGTACMMAAGGSPGAVSS